jgi:23S rRNA pseudouridine2605 synthase
MGDQDSSATTSEKLAKYLARCGAGSRRHCEEFIRAGWVEVDDQVVDTPETRINSIENRIKLRGVVINPPEFFRYILFNKPIGVLSTCQRGKERGRTVLDFVQVSERIFPVGRLDRDTSGLLILTNDGELTNRLLHPRYSKEKEYIVLTGREATDEELNILRKGVILEDGLSRFKQVTRTGRNQLQIMITEGRNRQIRRTLKKLELHIISLHRVRMGPIELKEMPTGDWRDLNSDELEKLRQSVTKQSE